MHCLHGCCQDSHSAAHNQCISHARLHNTQSSSRTQGIDCTQKDQATHEITGTSLAEDGSTVVNAQHSTPTDHISNCNQVCWLHNSEYGLFWSDSANDSLLQTLQNTQKHSKAWNTHLTAKGLRYFKRSDFIPHCLNCLFVSPSSFLCCFGYVS